MQNVKDKKITVLGAARSGVAAAQLLKDLGAIPFVSDTAVEESKSDVATTLRKSGIAFEFGQHSPAVFDAEFVVLSPGIPVRSAIVQQILGKEIPVYSEIEVASWFFKGSLIAVTGSNGKTTTTTLIGEMLKRVYPQAQVVGNIGNPFAASVQDTVEDSWSVIEVSSFQLETIDTFHPQQSLVLNFAPNHLDRYPDYEAYLEAKWRITKNLTSQDQLIYNADDEPLSKWALKHPALKQGFTVGSGMYAAARFDGKTIYLSDEKLIDVCEMKLRGAHNYMNAMAAALAARNAQVPLEDIRTVLQNFAGVEHRLEFVREHNGVKFINDSKATTVESLAVALESFDVPIILITGGKDKGSDFSKLNNRIAKYVKEIILIGSSTEKMRQTWQDLKPISLAYSLEDAVQMANNKALSGEVVLLSPACASFDMFSDYEDRGRQYKQIVHTL